LSQDDHDEDETKTIMKTSKQFIWTALNWNTQHKNLNNKSKLALVQVAFYAFQPGNGLGLFYDRAHEPIRHDGQYMYQNVGILFRCCCAKHYKHWLTFGKVTVKITNVQFFLRHSV